MNHLWDQLLPAQRESNMSGDAASVNVSNAVFEQTSSSFDDRARDLVRDLHAPKPGLFWLDLTTTAVVAWSAFFFSVVSKLPVAIPAILLASFAFYRGLCFIHELTHIRRNSLPGFETAWNLLFGVPLLLPSFVYVGVHQDHHKISTYGTPQDPEYMPFAQSNFMPVAFVSHSVLIPLFLLIRFVLISPLALLIPSLHKLLAARASALSMNLAYQRSITDELTRNMRFWESLILGVWGTFFIAMWTGLLPWSTLAIWYAIAAIASVVNTLRTLGAHHYRSDGEPIDRIAQLADSIDTPGGFWTGLWAPVGLRYHALHHYFPGIPYHNLAEAHRRLIGTLPPAAAYCQTVSPGLWCSLASLYRHGCVARTARARRTEHPS